MAAAYQTGSAADQTVLVQTLVTWLVAQGWTNNSSIADGSGWRAHLSKGGQFINLRAYFNADTNANIWTTVALPNTQKAGIALYVGTGYSGAAAWKAQAGGPIRQSNTDTVGANILIPSNAISAYHFFDDGLNNIAVVVEKSAGVFAAFGWGKLQAAGTITGGDYFFGGVNSNSIGDLSTANPPNGYTLNGFMPFAYGNGYYENGVFEARAYVRADVDTFTGKWVSCGNGSSTINGTGLTGYSEVSTGGVPSVSVPRYQAAIDRSSNAANGRGILLPMNFYATRSAGGVSLIGRVPSLFVTRKLYAAASTVTIGAQNYVAFPAIYDNPAKTCSFLIPKP